MRISLVISVTLGGGLLANGGLRAQAVRDSAGVQVVENKSPSLPAARAWRVDPKSTLVIGDPTAPTEGDSLYEFRGVMGLTRLANGHWAIGVQSANAIRFYDANGRYMKSAGRAGDGPGEFRSMMGLWAARGDTLVVREASEVEYFTPDGKFIAQGASRRTTPGIYVSPAGVLADRSYVGVNYNDRTIPPAGRTVRRRPLYRVSPDGLKLDTLAVIPTDELVFDGRRSSGPRVTFSPYANVTSAGNRVFHGYPGRAEVTELTDAGRAVRIFRLDVPPRPVTTADQEEHRRWALDTPGEDGRPIPPALREQRERGINEAGFAATFPVYSLMLADRAGNLWLRRFDVRQRRFKPGPLATITVDAPTTWDVVGPTGRWLCTVESPANFTPLEIGADYMAGVAHDADDIEMIKVYRIVKP